MAYAITGIDHALIGVRSLEGARGAFERLGFTISPRGRHIGWGTANYCIMFRHDYLELLGILDRSQFTNNLDRFLETRQGLMALAFATDDAVGAHERLTEAGIAAEPPKALKRIIETPHGDVKPEFRLVHLPAEATPALSSFICQHLTPELVWQERLLTHRNCAHGIAGVTAVVEDPGALGLAYAKLFGHEKVRASDSAIEVAVGGATLRFVTATALASVHPGLKEAPNMAAPWLAALSLRTTDAGRTAGFLDVVGASPEEDGSGRIAVQPDFAAGVFLEFEESPEPE